MGDAVIWSNVDKNGKADPDMVHQGLPPQEGVKVRGWAAASRGRTLYFRPVNVTAPSSSTIFLPTPIPC